jgi:hypothetical protein
MISLPRIALVLTENTIGGRRQRRPPFYLSESKFTAMKALFAFAFVILTSSFCVAQEGLKTDFQSAFTTSIKGLQNTKPSLKGFERVNVVKDETLGVYGVKCEKTYPSAEEAETALQKMTTEMANWLPAGEYASRRTYSAAYAGSMKTMFEFNSGKMADQQKRPTIELGVVESDGKFVLTMILFEPYFKNQYKPVMP